MEKLTAPSPIVTVGFGSGGASSPIDGFVAGFEFADVLEGKASTMEVILEDKEGYFRESYWPKKGNNITAAIGYDSGPLQGLWSCGDFVMDEISVAGPPTTVTIRGLGVSVKVPTIRERKSRGFENQTLMQIASKVAADLEISVEGSAPDIVFNRISQVRETDLAFLNRLAVRYGCIFKVTPTSLVIHKLKSLLGAESSAHIDLQDAIRFDFRSKAGDSPMQRVTRRWNPQTKLMVQQELASKMRPVVDGSRKAPGAKGSGGGTWLGGERVGRFDTDKILDRIEDATQAQARLDASMVRAQLGIIEGSLTIYGDPRLRAGMTTTLSGFGAMIDGSFVVTRAQHFVRRAGGFTTTLDVSSNPYGGGAVGKRKVPTSPHTGKP